MFVIKTIINLISIRSISILIISLCVGTLLSCSGGDVTGQQFNISTDGINFSDPEFTVNDTFKYDFPVENHIRVKVEAINGEVIVTGQEDTNRVLVTAHLYVSSDNLVDAELHLEDLDILVTESTTEILIQTVQPENINGRKYSVEYDIFVPISFEVVVSQTNGTITILDIQNSVEVSNENGEVFLYGIVGGIIADVENGSIEGNVVLPHNESIDLSVDNGSLELNIPTSISAEFSATVNGIGEITVSNLNITDSLITGKSHTGTLGYGEGSIVLSTVNGDIEVFGID